MKRKFEPAAPLPFSDDKPLSDKVELQRSIDSLVCYKLPEDEHKALLEKEPPIMPRDRANRTGYMTMPKRRPGA